MRFRIGLNLGDIVHDEKRIYGDGINIAARLEALADPGGVPCPAPCTSRCTTSSPGRVRGHGRAPTQEHRRAGARLSHRRVGRRVSPNADPPATTAARHRRIVSVVVVSLVVIAGAAVWWTSPHLFPGRRAVRTEALRLSIVVLPFTNLSGDPNQDYFADGITEDLTTDLSRLAGSLVISRNTAFTFKGKVVDARQIGRELGVRYVLEGSVRRMGRQRAHQRAARRRWHRRSSVGGANRCRSGRAGDLAGQPGHREPTCASAQCRARQRRGPQGAARQC